MKLKIGIIYSSVNGQTLKICESLYNFFKKNGYAVKIYSIENFNEKIANFNLLIIGASIRYGNHNNRIIQFIANNKEHLQKIKTAFFSVNLVARKKSKNLPTTNPYILKFLSKTEWKPNFINVFAGKVDYKLYSVSDKIIIKLIMLITNDPLKTKHPIEFTNWEKVENFGIEIHEYLQKLPNI